MTHTNKLLAGIILAGTLALSAGVATPTQAQGLSFSFGNGVMHNGVELRFRNGHFDNNYCLNSREIRSQLRAQGFRDVQVIRDLGHRTVLAVGRKGSQWYQLVVNSCTGAVDQQRIRRSSNGNFSFSLTFGGSNGGYGNGDNHGRDGSNDHGNGGPGNGGNHEELVCYVTFFDASQVDAGADADVERARVMPRSRAEAIDRPNDRSAIFDYGTDQQTTATCNELDRMN